MPGVDGLHRQGWLSSTVWKTGPVLHIDHIKHLEQLCDVKYFVAVMLLAEIEYKNKSDSSFWFIYMTFSHFSLKVDL